MLKDQAGVMQQLSAWYASKDGTRSRQALDVLMQDWLSGNFGHCALEMSSLLDHVDWMQSSEFRSRFRIGPVEADAFADFDALPIDTESLDLVIACHTLEFAKDPYCLLREIDRVLIPEGRCVIVTFNPLGLQGLARPLKLFRNAPWCGYFYSLSRIKDWLSVLGFSVEKSGWFSPPFVINGSGWSCKGANYMLAKGLSWMGSLSALYVRKQVSRMIPLSAKWSRRSLLKGEVAQPTVLNPHDV